MAAELALNVAGASLRLLAERAVWWPAQRALLVADVHLGKDAVFRAEGLAVPAGSTAGDLALLTALCRRFPAERLIVLGDLVHGRPGMELVAEVAAWRQGIPNVEVLLVRGNHDRHLDVLPRAWRMAETACCRLDALRLCHAPSTDGGGASGPAELAGHLHPVCVLRDGRGDAMRVPVFWLHGLRLVLPAFGSFTGGLGVRPRQGDRVFAVGAGHVVEVAAR